MSRKLFYTFIILIIMTILLPFIGSFNKVNAATDYKYDYYTDSIYEVDYINDKGSFDFVDSFDNFDSAKKFMKTNKDYVVRCKYGYSPTRIVAMNSGLVYSYPRGSSDTQDLYESWGSDKYDKTISYTSRRYEMTYVDTPYMSAKSGFAGQGYVEVICNGFDGYADVEYTDLIPSKFIDKKLSIYIGGPYSSNDISAYKVKVIPNYFIINKNGNYYDLEFHYHYAYPDSNGNVTEYKIKIDNAANYKFMQNGVRYFSDDGYNFYTDYKKNSYVGTCYPYYQFLSLRTKTDIDATNLNGFLKNTRSDYSSSKIYKKGDKFIELGDKYGCNASLIYALTCLESSYGTSDYAIYRNNLFGWNAFDDSPNDASYFSSVDVAIQEHMGRNLRKYSDYTDGRYNGTYVGNKGSGFNLKYASDPYWGMKIASIYYSIDKYANNNNGKLTDYNKWSLGLIKNFGVGIYSDEKCKNKICNTNYTSSRQIANIVVLLEELEDTYKIQFSNPINGNVIKDQDGVFGYSWSKSVAYMKKKDVEVLNSATVYKKEEPIVYTHESITSLENVLLDENSIRLSGIGAISNLDFIDTSSITHTIKLIDMNNTENIYSYNANVIDTNGFSMNDGFDYRYSGFDVTIDLSELQISSYYIVLNTVNGEYSYDSILRTTNLDYRSISNIYDDINYHFSANQDYAYRAEIDISKSSLDYSSINKPSKRSSMKQFDSLKIDDNGCIDFNGYSMIYYLNYKEENDNRFNLIFVDESTGIFKKFTLMNTKISDAVNSQINSVYDISYIGFESYIDLSLLELGNYTLMLEINTDEDNENYHDLLEFNAEDRLLPSNTIGNRIYTFKTGNVRNRLMLEVSEVD